MLNRVVWICNYIVTMVPKVIEHIKAAIHYIGVILPYMLQGATVTLQIFSLTLILALPLGLVIAIANISKFKILKGIANAYIWLLRGTPLLLQLFFVYYGLPAFGIVFDRFPAAVIAFVLNYAAYFAEIYRSGIESIDHGQYEAAKALGYTYGKTMTKIVIPQTIKRILPPITNETITLIKDTALVASIAVPEMLKAAKDTVNRDVDTTAFLVAAVIYLIFTLVLTKILRFLEKKSSYYERKKG